MAKIISFKTREEEGSILGLFDMACDLIFAPQPAPDYSRKVGDLVQKAVLHTGENPHYFSTEKLARLELLLSS